MTDIDIDAIRQRLNAASDGPWTAHPDGLVWAPRIGDPVSGSTETADAEFIAHARTDVPALLAKVDELTADLDRLTREHVEANTELTQAWAALNRAGFQSPVDGIAALIDLMAAALAEARATANVRQGQLTKSREQAATYANEIGRLTAENARVRQQRDGQAAVIEAAKRWTKSWGELKGTDTIPYALAMDCIPLAAAVRALPKAEATR